MNCIPEDENPSSEEICNYFIDSIRQRIAKANLPTRLKDLNLTIEQLSLAVEDVKQEVKRNIVTNVQPIEHNEDMNSVVKTEQQREHEIQDEKNIPSSRIEIDDSDIPSFIKKLKPRF